MSEPQQIDKRRELSGKLVAYVSVEDTSVVKEGSKELRGHIRRFNLAKPRIPRGDTLKEVSFLILVMGLDFLSCFGLCKLKSFAYFFV